MREWNKSVKKITLYFERLGKEKMVQWTSPFTIGITIMISNSECTTPIIRLTYIHSPINLYIVKLICSSNLTL